MLTSAEGPSTFVSAGYEDDVANGAWPVMDGQCNGEEIQWAACLKQPPCGKCKNIDCELSDWDDWSSGDCTGLCQRERMVKVRNNECGKPCEGALEETRGGPECHICSEKPNLDCVWSAWTDWSACTCSCNGGQKTRDRRIHISPEGGGLSCPPFNRTEVAPCNVHHCGPDCRDGEWAQWSDWGECTATCGGGASMRSRKEAVMANECGVPATGKSQEFRICSEDKLCQSKDSVDCLFADWGDWSDCSCTCDGVKRRSRLIAQFGAFDGKWCEGGTKELAPCNPDAGEMAFDNCTAPEIKDCIWGDWEDWGKCTTDCDGGQRSRERPIDVPAAGGRPCMGAEVETGPCGLVPCLQEAKVVDCEWGLWADWGACDKCGGERRRYRHVNMMPEHGGKPCAAQDSEEFSSCVRHCHEHQYCAWSDWSLFGDCSTSCGAGLAKRHRKLVLSRAAPASTEAIQKDYDDMLRLVDHVSSTRVQGLAVAFTGGCAGFLLLLSAGRACQHRLPGPGRSMF